MSEDAIKALLNDKEALRNTTKQIFSEIDSDNSGFIERKEFGLCVDKLLSGMDPAPSEEEKVAIIKTIDVNKDGKLSIEEFESMVIDSLKTLIE